MGYFDVKTEQELKNKTSLTRRLSRIEGQVRGIKSMIEQESHYSDVLIQVLAVSAAINSFSKELLGYQIKTNVSRDIKEGKNESIDELIRNVQKLMK